MSKLNSRSDVVWFVGVGIALALAALKWDGARSVDANFLALLPQAQHDPLVDAATARLAGATEDRMFWLVGGGSREAAASAAAMLSQMLESSALFQRDDASTDTNSISRYSRLFPYRFQLLDAATLRSLDRDPESIVATAIGNTMGPFGVLRTQQLVPDPLALFPHYLGTLMPAGIELFDGMPMVRSGDRHYALLLTTAIRGAFDLDETDSLLDFVAQARAWAATRGVELLVTGVPLFAATNAQRAQFEVSTVGTGSMIAVILLFLITFRSARPLLLATLAIGTGLLVAFTVSIWLFDRVHLLTFVFGATLIGVSDDYALHYLCDAFRSPNWSPKDATRRVLPGLALGLATTLTAYASLGIAPFPALRQIAVFCGAGLLGAWLTVVLLLPSHTKALRSSPALMRMGLAYAQRFPLIADRWVFVSAGLCLAALAALFYCVQPSDDVRLLQTQMPQLTQEAASIESLIADRRDNQFLLVESTSAEATLNTERSVRAVLDLLMETQKLRAYSAISSAYPSPAEQHRNYQQLKAKLYDGGAMQRFFDVLHARPETMAAHRAEFDSSLDRNVPLEEWLAIVGSPWSELWLGCSDGRCASLITLNGYAALTPGRHRIALSRSGRECGRPGARDFGNDGQISGDRRPTARNRICSRRRY